MELFHTYNRGVDKRSIVLDDKDRTRFVRNLYELNDADHVHNLGRLIDVGCQSPRERRPLVKIHGWCLMNNHYHLLLSAEVPQGISRFLQKINMAYAKYFNERYERSGALFQGKTKKKHINNEAYFLHILHYIHLKPLDYTKGSKDWRSFFLIDSSKALAQLKTYRWSSYLDYCGIENAPLVLSTGLFTGVFGNYEKTLRTYVKDLSLDEELTLLDI